VVEAAVIIIEKFVSGDRSGALVGFLLQTLLAFVGVLVNAAAGMAAHRRGEAGGRRMAVLGIAMLIGTIVVLRAR
jgi:hypothetical protein